MKSLSSSLKLNKEDDGHWVAVSDLMAGLMMVFMLIAVLFMAHVEQQREKIAEVVVLYDRLKRQLHQDLTLAFSEDFKRWGASLSSDLSIRFERLDALFDEGESRLKPEFKSILADFFPRYIKILTQAKYRDDILEVRIEGHTSSRWLGAKTFDEAYVRNMALSQERTRSTLAFLLDLVGIEDFKPWMISHFTANGLSSAKILYDAQGYEDEYRSRRVEFRVLTHAEKRLATLLEALAK